MFDFKKMKKMFQEKFGKEGAGMEEEVKVDYHVKNAIILFFLDYP